MPPASYNFDFAISTLDELVADVCAFVRDALEDPDGYAAGLTGYGLEDVDHGDWAAEPRFWAAVVGSYVPPASILTRGGGEDILVGFFVRLGADTAVAPATGSAPHPSEVFTPDRLVAVADLVRELTRCEVDPDRVTAALADRLADCGIMLHQQVPDLSHFTAAVDALDDGTFAERFPTAYLLLTVQDEDYVDDFDEYAFEELLSEWSGEDDVAEVLASLVAGTPQPGGAPLVLWSSIDCIPVRQQGETGGS